MKYKGEESAPFSWVYLDETVLKNKCHENGFDFEIVQKGDHHDYLAKLTNK